MSKSSRWPLSLTVGLTMAAVLLVIAIVAPLVWGTAATELTPNVSQGPGAGHVFGTDKFGRDVLARTLVATQLTFLLALGATVLAVILGVLIGGLVWLAPRLVREIVLRVIDATVAFPALILALIIAAILGPGSTSAVIAIGAAGIPGFARITANMVAVVVNRDYVTTARLFGVPAIRVFTRHLLPNVAGPLLVLIASSFALTLLDVSSLSFVGLGVQSPEFDFGRLLNEALPNIYTRPLEVLAPSIMLVFSGVTAFMIGDGLAARHESRGAGVRVRHADSRKVPQSARVAGALVDVQNLVVTGPAGQEIVKSISFTIEPGEILGLVGESGSGKSLTAMSLAGLLPDGVNVAASQLRVGELDLTVGASPRALATQIGLVFQDPGTTYNPALRMGSQLTEVARVHLGLSRRRATETLVSALEKVKVTRPEERMRQHPYQLSGGMLQRATIASSMVTAPSLIIADEPTTALDVTVQAQVLREFKHVNRTQSTAMLFISHDLGVVQELCDRVLVMRHGEIIERLTGEQLRSGEVEHPYTKQLLAATPTMTSPLVRLGSTITEGGSADGR